jgi:hypothetical protein
VRARVPRVLRDPAGQRAWAETPVFTSDLGDRAAGNTARRRCRGEPGRDREGRHRRFAVVLHDGRVVVPPSYPTMLVMTRHGGGVCLAAINAVELIKPVWLEVIDLTD